ncbi:hypothetical protein GCM10010149_18230 [Nonomuraea roseoviolacea subsp. roseoviolacea]
MADAQARKPGDLFPAQPGHLAATLRPQPYLLGARQRAPAAQELPQGADGAETVHVIKARRKGRPRDHHSQGALFLGKPHRRHYSVADRSLVI